MEHPLACRLEFGVTSRREERTSDPKVSVMSRKNGWCGTMCVISPARYPDGSTSLLPQQRLGFQGVPRLKIVVCVRERKKGIRIEQSHRLLLSSNKAEFLLFINDDSSLSYIKCINGCIVICH